MTNKGSSTLETERLILRKFSLDDAEAMYNNWASDPEVTKFLMWPTHDSVDVSRAVLASWIPQYDKADYYHWGIELKDSATLIGSIAAVDQNPRAQLVHIGYCIGRAWWRKGYTSEALCRLVRFFFEEVGVNRIESRHDPRNLNSGKVMRKAGLLYEGTSRESDYNNQGIRDAANYGMLAKDYFTGKEADGAGVTIVPYKDQYRADMLFCYLSAKDAISGEAPGQWGQLELKDDLLDIDKYYFGRGDVFYLALDWNGRVVGMIGTHIVSPGEMWLKRLFIKPGFKRKGIGGKLLAEAEQFASAKGITIIHTRFADWYREAAAFYPAKGFIDAEFDKADKKYLRHMIKNCIYE